MPDDLRYIAEPGIAHQKMSKKWELIEDLLEGTNGMRKKSRQYLPQQPRERSDAYKARLSRSFLYGAYEDAVDYISSRPFSKEVSVEGDLSETMRELMRDVDNEGSDITSFSKQLFRTGVDYGLIHLLVDHPPMPDGLSLADEREAGARPYFVNVIPSKVLRWIVVRVGGKDILTEVRIKDSVVLDVEGKESETEVLNVWRRRLVEEEGVATVTLEKYQRDAENNEWIGPVEIIPYSYPEIPLFTAYFNKKGFLMGAPPLFKLAELNLRHYQTESDQSNILRIASLGLLSFTGWPEEDIEKGIVFGPNSYVATSATDAKAEFIEYKGKAIEANFTRLEKLENRMEAMGHQPFITAPGKVTATRDKIKDERRMAPIQSWIRELEKLLRWGLDAMATWRNEELSSTAKINVFSDFVATARTKEDLEHLRKLQERHTLSKRTLLMETKRRNVLGEDVDVDEEMDRAAGEAELVSDVLDFVPEPEDAS